MTDPTPATRSTVTTADELPEFLAQRGFALTDDGMPRVPAVCFELDDAGRPRALDPPAVFSIPGTEELVELELPRISELARGDTDPGRFGSTPPDEYTGFFHAIEFTAAVYSAQCERPVTDQEFHRLYRHLLRRPDGTERHPLFGYLQAATRMYMLLHDTSQKEFEAVVQRLVRSTKTFSMGSASRNYWKQWLVNLV